MIIKSKIQCVLRIGDGEEIVFTAHEPVVIPARWAVPLLMKFPDAVELVSSVVACPGSHVTWRENGEQSQTGMVLVKIKYNEESWVFVITEDKGRFIRESDIIGVNAAPLCRLAWDAAQRLKIPEAESWAADVVTTMFGIGLNDMTQ